MGSVLSQAGKSPVLKWGTRNPREATFVGWVSLVLVLQQYERLTSRTSGGEHVKIKGQLFKQSAGGEVNLGASGSMEYYVTTLIRVFETYGMYKAGERFFMPDKNGEGGVVSRFRGLLFAAFVLLPVLDLAVPKDWANPRKEEQTTKKGDRKFRIPLYMWAVMEVLTTFKVLQVASNPKTKLTAMQQAACVGSLAVFNGAVGINASHELVHKASKLEKFLSYMMLANVNYVHWGWEHTHGHHENVATPGDPASSRLGESFYSFLPRTLFGTWWSAWKIEQGRLDQSGEHRVLQNRMAWGAMVPFLWASVIAKASGGGAKAYALFYAQGLGSAVLLELVNYLEHYGLQRKLVTNPKDPAGEPIYEAVNPTHSWNAPHRLSNAFLFKLQRHSDHHTFSMREYHLLRNFEESPQLPSGYPGMVTLALVPPLWRYIMDDLVAANNKRVMGSAKDSEVEVAFREASSTANKKMAAYSVTLFGLAVYAIRNAEIERAKVLHAARRAASLAT